MPFMKQDIGTLPTRGEHPLINSTTVKVHSLVVELVHTKEGGGHSSANVGNLGGLVSIHMFAAFHARCVITTWKVKLPDNRAYASGIGKMISLHCIMHPDLWLATKENGKYMVRQLAMGSVVHTVKALQLALPDGPDQMAELGISPQGVKVLVTHPHFMTTLPVCMTMPSTNAFPAIRRVAREEVHHSPARATRARGADSPPTAHRNVEVGQPVAARTRTKATPLIHKNDLNGKHQALCSADGTICLNLHEGTREDARGIVTHMRTRKPVEDYRPGGNMSKPPKDFVG